MSITLITGVPGSGKTLKAVYDHLRPYVGHVDISTNDKGEVFSVPSVVYTNINSLQLDHEFIDGGGKWELSPVTKEWAYSGNPEGLRNWHNWAKPGAKIFFDEFQKYWPPRPNGSAVPPDIQTLDTHRHMGVDFVLITQNCMNVDRHILGLVDRHLHVRRVANMPLAVVYEWDHASKTLNYKNSMSKSPWRYPRNAYKLYKSAELHTKQKRKLPGLVWFVLAGFCGAAVAWPTLKNRLDDRIHGVKPVTAAGASPAPKVGEKVQYQKDGINYTVETVATPPQPAATASAPSVAVSAAPEPQIAGCIVVKERCACFDTSGLKVAPPLDGCTAGAGLNGVDKAVIAEDLPRTYDPADGAALAFLRGVK